jgi:hypothetical protein
MPRYFFHTEHQPEPECRVLESLAEAKCEAVKLAGRTICDGADVFWDAMDWRMTVANEAGLTLFMLTFFGTEAAALAPKVTARSH